MSESIVRILVELLVKLSAAALLSFAALAPRSSAPQVLGGGGGGDSATRGKLGRLLLEYLLLVVVEVLVVAVVDVVRPLAAPADLRVDDAAAGCGVVVVVAELVAEEELVAEGR